MWYPSNKVPLGCISNTNTPSELLLFSNPKTPSPGPPPLLSDMETYIPNIAEPPITIPFDPPFSSTTTIGPRVFYTLCPISL